MNVYELISSIVTAMIWPILIIIVIAMLKKPITNLIQDIATIKYGGFELNFIRYKLEEIQEELKLENDSNLENDENKDVKNIKMKSSEKKIVKNSSLYESLDALDMKIYELYFAVDRKAALKKQIKDMDIPSVITYLQERKVINSKIAKIITDTRKLPDYFSKPLTKDVELKFTKTCEDLVSYLNSIYQLKRYK
ncbi:hypothetical protein [Bacillus pumilus]|uniref:hypothetical protein n=1 Tax=Bacillus pumilus TaxID=1408 RepID=UPI0011E8BF0A|nr:hypothetical protein [Bacillus pumilus]TYS31769.1 hypothetical protein FZC65_11150 [Bacillus pumilus]TYS47407.1 hypothetical protein FZC67_10720 [Bacillus pumilus]